MQGEGLIPGGILVVRSGTGGVVYAHQEQTFGDHAPIAEVWLMPAPTLHHLMDLYLLDLIMLPATFTARMPSLTSVRYFLRGQATFVARQVSM